MILSEQIREFVLELNELRAPEQLPSMAARAANFARSEGGPTAGACACAHALLMQLWHSAEGEMRAPDEWDADLRLIGMISHLIEHPSEVSLAGIGRAWQSRVAMK